MPAEFQTNFSINNPIWATTNRWRNKNNREITIIIMAEPRIRWYAGARTTKW